MKNVKRNKIILILFFVLIGLFYIGKSLQRVNLLDNIINLRQNGDVQEEVNYLRKVELDRDSMLLSEFYKDDLVAIYEYKVDESFESISYSYPLYVNGEKITAGRGWLKLSNNEGYIGFARKKDGEFVVLNLNIKENVVKDPDTGITKTTTNKSSSTISQILTPLIEYEEKAHIKLSNIFEGSTDVINDEPISLFMVCMQVGVIGEDGNRYYDSSCDANDMIESSKNGLMFNLNVTFSSKTDLEKIEEYEDGNQ